MSTLLDSIKQNRAKLEQQKPMGEELQRIAATRGGKVAPEPTGAQTVSLGEDIAARAALDQEQQQRIQQEVQAEQLRQQEAGLEQQMTQAQADIAQRRELTFQQLDAAEQSKITDVNNKVSRALQQMAADRNITLDDMFTQFERSDIQLQDRRDASKLEQLGFLLSLQDRSYMAELQRIGKEKRLQNDVNFQREALKTTLGEDMNMLIKQLGFEKAMNKDVNDLRIELGDMKIEDALAIADTAARGASAGRIIEGTTQLAEVGLDQYKPSPTEPGAVEQGVSGVFETQPREGVLT